MTRIILVGSSHMRSVQQFLQNEGYIVRVISLKGGLPTTSAIEELGDQLTSLGAAPGTAVVFDVFGNFTFRYEQEDVACHFQFQSRVVTTCWERLVCALTSCSSLWSQS